MNTKSRLIVALDVDSLEQARNIVDSIGEAISIYKIGHQLFTAEGPSIISFLIQNGKDVFLDLKLHEISNSVASAVKAAGRHGVKMVTVHASGGMNMMEAAVSAASEFPDMKILAVTVITGLGDADLAEIGFAGSCEDQVLRLAKLAERSGCHGVIASPLEIQPLRKTLNSDMLIVTPGIRPVEAEKEDQNRTGTPIQAIKHGASYIVVGRPIVKATNPAAAAKKIAMDIQMEISA